MLFVLLFMKSRRDCWVTLGRSPKPSGPQFLYAVEQDVESGADLRQGHRRFPEPSTTISFEFLKVGLTHLGLWKTSF